MCVEKPDSRLLARSPHPFDSVTYVGASRASPGAPSCKSWHLSHCASQHVRTRRQQVHENVGRTARDEVMPPPLIPQGHPADLLSTTGCHHRLLTIALVKSGMFSSSNQDMKQTGTSYFPSSPFEISLGVFLPL